MSQFPKPCYLLGLIWSDHFCNGHECPQVARPLQIAFWRKKVTCLLHKTWKTKHSNCPYSHNLEITTPNLQITFRWELSKLSHPLPRSDTEGGNWGAMTGRQEGCWVGKALSYQTWEQLLIPPRNGASSTHTHTHTMKDNFSGVAREVVAQGHWQNSQAVPQAKGLCLQMFICKWMDQQSLSSQDSPLQAPRLGPSALLLLLKSYPCQNLSWWC